MEKKKEVVRKERVPINGTRNIMDISKYNVPDDLHPCWVNDYNVDRFVSAGYEFWYDRTAQATQTGDLRVNSDSQIGAKVTKNVGNGVIGYLMVIPNDIWNEDVAKLHREIDEKESIMHRQIQQGEGRYGRVKIDVGSKS